MVSSRGFRCGAALRSVQPDKALQLPGHSAARSVLVSGIGTWALPAGSEVLCLAAVPTPVRSRRSSHRTRFIRLNGCTILWRALERNDPPCRE